MPYALNFGQRCSGALYCNAQICKKSWIYAQFSKIPINFCGPLQWLFLVPLIGGRWYIIPQLAVYTTYTTLKNCQLWGYMLPIPPIKGTRFPAIDPSFSEHAHNLPISFMSPRRMCRLLMSFAPLIGLGPLQSTRFPSVWGRTYVLCTWTSECTVPSPISSTIQEKCCYRIYIKYYRL